MTIQEYERMKTLAEEQKQRSDKAAGAMEQLKSQLADQFQCKTIKEAKQKAMELQEQAKEQKAEAERLMEEFQTKHSQLWDNR